VKLLSNELETPTTRRIRLALDGRPFTYRAGQAASIAARSGESTPYSIASAPCETARDGALEFLVKVDGSTRFGSMVEGLSPGTPIGVEGPIGNFVLPDPVPDRPLLFIAGGTGIAPMRSMLRQVLHDRQGARPALVYSARTPEEFAYVAELRALDDAGRIALTLTLTGDAADWRHARGRAGADHLAALATPRTLCFICGPPSMVTDVPQALMTLGVPREHVRTEDW
jgi:ferredoxin-NADP reductase